MIHTGKHSDDPHYISRSGWLRAAVLGANDGIVSTSALIVGVAAANPAPGTVALAGFAGLAAGAMSMAAGEYVSVSSQADLERADIARERAALDNDPEGELLELIEIWENRGLSTATARQMAWELTHNDALEAHVRDELGLSEGQEANPLVAAMASGVTFSISAAVPLMAAIFAPQDMVIPAVLVITLICLLGLGYVGARAGGVAGGKPALRVMLWGALAMAITLAVGRLVGVSV